MEFLVLGPVEAREAGRPVRLSGMRRRRLLALLLLNARRAVAVDTLVDELWPDPPASARHQVHNAVRDLRAALAGTGGGGLITVDVGYRLDVPPEAVDAHRFTAAVRAARAARREGRAAEAARLLQSAVDLWRGDAYAGIDCPAVTAAAAGLDEQRLTAVEELMELRLAAGEAASLVAELSELTARHPLRDALRGSLMLALHRSGRQADALAVYEEGRRRLADELGLEPGPALRRLHTTILTGTPTPAPAPRAPGTLPSPGTPSTENVHPASAAPTTAPAPAPQAAPTNDETAWTTAVPAPAPQAAPTNDEAAWTTAAPAPAARAVLAADEAARTTAVPAHAPQAPPADDESEQTARQVPPPPRPVAFRPAHGNHLPPDLPDFTGRAAELALLERTVDGRSPGTPRTVAIDGMGGIGKTALAVHFAHRRTPRHPDGQYYVDLHGFSADRAPLTPEEALGVLLCSDGAAPEAVPAGLAERSALWRARLASRRALLVLDNAADTAQLVPLLPGTGDTLTLVTTRRKAAVPDGARTLSLGALPPQDAATLFRRVVGDTRADHPAVPETAALCGHHPLALRLAAARLRDRPSWTVPDVTARLRTPAGRTAFLRTADREVTSVLGLSHARLSPEALGFVRALALRPEPVLDLAGACAVTGLAPAVAEHLFDTLLDHNLVLEPSPGRFTVPLLLRDHAHTLTVPSQVTARHLSAVA